MTDLTHFLWEPLLESSAKTLAGALGVYSVGKVIQRLRQHNTFEGPTDFWRRGIQEHLIAEDDHIVFDGLISP